MPVAFGTYIRVKMRHAHEQPGVVYGDSVETNLTVVSVPSDLYLCHPKNDARARYAVTISERTKSTWFLRNHNC